MEAKKLEALKVEVIAEVEKNKDLVQQMVDQIFSYGELGFQEVETSKYLVALLKQNGFAVQRRSVRHAHRLVRALGFGQARDLARNRHRRDSQVVAEARVSPIPHRSSRARPGHGEGHNSGMAVNIVAAIAVKKLMERDKLPGTIVIWPGVAEELVGTKAIYVRDGFFKDVDITLFSHVDSEMKANWGTQGHNALVSVRYDFTGTAAHSAGSPWRGKSALDAVELMNAAGTIAASISSTRSVRTT
jgi:aminobenzoyl-glutamate utilization protein B